MLTALVLNNSVAISSTLIYWGIFTHAIAFLILFTTNKLYYLEIDKEKQTLALNIFNKKRVVAIASIDSLEFSWLIAYQSMNLVVNLKNENQPINFYIRWYSKTGSQELTDFIIEILKYNPEIKLGKYLQKLIEQDNSSFMVPPLKITKTYWVFATTMTLAYVGVVLLEYYYSSIRSFHEFDPMWVASIPIAILIILMPYLVKVFFKEKSGKALYYICLVSLFVMVGYVFFRDFLKIPSR
ncbi:hypothetical protein KKB40_04420 [Patescibacteria group bacterium]|nr:hypothetical protein [Patescibacteria group bacterium]